MLNGSLAMYVTFQKFHFLSHLQATGNNFVSLAAQDPRNHKSAMHYSLFGNVSCAGYP